MRRLVFLLLLSGMALAQCGGLVAELESSYAPYLHLDAVDCAAPPAPTLYAPLAQLAEGYSQAAQCYSEAGDADKARAYHTISAEKYSLAADSLCATDHSLRAQLYISSGDAYRAARQDAMALESYRKAERVCNLHPTKVDSTIQSRIQLRIYELGHPVADSVHDVGEPERASWVPIAVAALAFAGIGLVIFQLRR